MRRKTPRDSVEINIDRLPGNCWTIGHVTRCVLAAIGAPARYAPAGSRGFKIPDGRELVIAIGKNETMEQAIEGHPNRLKAGG